MSRNMLAEETSPYLLQHKDNPVHWRPWNQESLALAQTQDKPILLSIGYSACHWCHVMAHESFENPDIAALMNDSFISIKVDREERPDLDAVYQAALGMLGEHGGWPLTMFLTPAGEPFWGGTYFPPTSRYGRPGFPDVLRSLAETYQGNKDAVTKNADALREGLAKLSETKHGEGISAERMDQVASAALRIVDPYLGGTHGAPKFPQPVFFQFLWQAYIQNGSRMFQEAVIITLDNLCQGGIYDHLGGGFARYATDNAWLVPHFEKMLYDNALMIELLTDAWRGTKRDLYAVRIRESIDWLLRDMRVFAKDGDNRSYAFASAFDADSEGEEGRYYVWNQDEIDALLGDDAAAFSEAYQVTPMGNWEHKTILNRSHQLSLSAAAVESKLEQCRATLLAVRDTRVPPLRDDKVLADWNGLAIAALANAGTVFAEPAWIDAARTAFTFVIENMSDDDNLRHSWRQGRARDESVLDDYANMSRAALALYNATGDAIYLEKARAWVAVANSQFRDEATGGYFLSGKDSTDVIARSKSAIDNAVPSGNGTMVDVLARLFYMTGEPIYRERAEETIKTFAGESVEYMVNTPMLLMGAGFLEGGTQVVIVGIDSDPAALALERTAFEAFAPASIVLRLNPDEQLPDTYPAAGKGMLDGKPTAYVCKGPVCGPPTNDPTALEKLLSAPS